MRISLANQVYGKLYLTYDFFFDKYLKSFAFFIFQADEFEVGSLFNYGSKKQSLNHLLNFQFEPRNFAGSKNINLGRGSNPHMSRKRNDPMTRRPKYSKEQYLQAK